MTAVIFGMLAAGVLLGAAEPQGTQHKVLRRIELGGSGGWDYLTLDPAGHRLFITRGDHVSVVDVATGKSIGEVPKTDGVHGVALVPEVGKGFASNGRSNTVTIFDLKTLAVLGEVKTGDKPDAIIYDPASKRVFAFNGHSNDATAIDAAKGAAVGTVALGGAPEFAAADGHGRVFVNLEDKNEVVAIDSAALTVKNRWSIAPCDAPTGLSMDTETHRIFSGCASKVLIVSDADAGKVVATVPIGAGTDATAFDSKTKLVYSSNGDGTLTVIREETPDKFVVVENAKTEVGARTMALDPGSHKVYLVTAKFGPPPSPTAEHPHPRGAILPDTFVLLEVGH